VAEVRSDPRAALTHGEVIAGVSALLLLIVMFATKWYGVAGVPGTSAHAQAVSTENAWRALSVVRWVVLLTIGAAFASLAVHLVSISRNTVALVRLTLAVLSALTAVLVTYRVLIDLPSSSDVVDQKLGAVLGLVCAYGIAVGAFEAIREQRARASTGTRSSDAQPPVASTATRR
jgi:hypothetical protein